MTNPLLAASTLPYGLPAFAEIRDEHYAEAIRAGLAEHLAEIEAITSSSDAADFENTAAAMERSGQLVARAAAAFMNVVSSHGTDGIRALETELMPELSAHEDAVYLNRTLYERFAAIPTGGLDDESARLVSEWLAAFRRAGIALDDAGKARLREINAELSRLGTEYGQRVAKGINEAAVLVTDEAELAGMPDDDRASAAEAARAAGHETGWLLTFLQPTAQPQLAVLEDRSVRRRVFEASVARGSSGGPTDVLDLVTDMARLRAEKAALLGFADFAALAVDDQTAPSTEAVAEMLGRLAPAAVLDAALLWGEGFATTEYLGAALLDLAWHGLRPGDEPSDALAFEAKALADTGVAVPLVPPRYRTGYFQHIFAGGWYAAGYWSYIWSEVLDADTVEWFRENGGLTRTNGETFRRELLSRGNSRDPLASFRAFRGRDADVAPLIARRGLG